MSFSERHGFESPAIPIKYREDASANLREMVIELAEKHGLSPHSIRSHLCGLLFVAPDPSNWSPYPNIDGECRTLIGGCEWHEVYDAIEIFWRPIYADRVGLEAASLFQKDINRLFMKDGAGWQMIDGLIIARGSEPFNVITRDARQILEKGRNQTAASEIHEAIKDISRRPNPDKTGAVHHAMGAIECITRSLTSNPKSTLGEIIKSKSKLHGIPPPLDEAISKMWGYSSEKGRHIRPKFPLGNTPTH
jgi:hypothetical protein